MSIQKKEKKHLENILSIINIFMNNLSISKKGLKKEIISSRSYSYENFTKDFFSGENNDVSEFLQNTIELQISEKRYIDIDNNIRILTKLKKNPYFAKVETEDTSFYFGTNTLKDDNHIYIYDWRSPIAELYYGNLENGIYKDLENKEIKFNIIKKFQISIENGVIQGIYLGTSPIRDNIIMEMSEYKMHSIVNSIQEEQMKIIKNNNLDNFIILGPAGSGKTAIIFHKVAYLLFYKRNKLQSENFLFITNNNHLNDYVDSILPELGEKSIKQDTFNNLLNEIFNTINVETDFEKFKRHEKIDKNVLEYFYSNEFKKKLDMFFDDTENIKFNSIIVNKDIILNHQEIATIFKNEYYSKNDMTSSMSKVKKKIKNRINKYSENYFNELFIKLVNTEKYIGELEEIEEEVNNKRKRFDNKLNKFIDNYSFINYNKMIENVLSSINNGYEKSMKSIINKGTYEYNLIKAFIKTKYEEVNYKKVIKYLIIDEIQEYSSIHFDIIKKIFRDSIYILTGDYNQSLLKYDFDHINNKDFKVIQLSNTYRSTKEISEFNQQFISKDINIYGIYGKKPTIFLYNDLKSTLLNIVNSNSTITIIASDYSTYKQIYIVLFNSGIDFTFSPSDKDFDVFLLLPYQVSGLEFNNVIFVNSDHTYTSKFLYTIFSRAIKNLYILSDFYPDWLKLLNKNTYYLEE